jgi:diguanylate cyclase (GGDEF)-like protein
MTYSHRVRRAALVGLAVTLLALIGLSVLGSASTRSSAQTVARSAALAEAYGRAHDAVAAEESLERKYRLEPGGAVRAAHRAAGDDLDRALGDIGVRGGPADRRLVDTLRVLHDSYRWTVASMFTAADAGDDATVERIDNQQTDPVFTRMSDLVQAATDQHARVAAGAVAGLHRVEGLVFLTTAVGLAVGVCLLAVFAVVAVGYHRALLRQAALGQHQALHDALTGLPNRTLFADRLTHALLSCRRSGDSVAVLLLDLDRFKEVNDSLGHQYGDELLRQFGTRVDSVLRAGDTLARLSGDEFAVLLPNAGAEEATALAERVIAGVHQSFTVHDVTVDVEVSVGVAVAPAHAEDTEALLRCADVAMYAAKDAKTGLVVYRPEMHIHDSPRLLLLGDLRRALDATDQLMLYYQPKVGLRFGEVCGLEALVRWQHPTRGMVAPADFIPIAETTGLINRLTSYVLRQAIQQAREWLDRGLSVPVAVNLSPRCLLDASLPTQVTSLLEEYRLPATLLRLEVTETAIMANPGLAMATLTSLHNLGVRLSIDDYGTGYSSMAYLKRLPVDELKVDRSFVLNMTGDDNDAILVRGAIDLGHNLGLTVVAEGVEGSEHVTALQDLGCDIAQGYHYARPMPPDELGRWLETHHTTHGAPVSANNTQVLS